MQFKLIAGLGNPGKEYTNTYHNVGMLCVDHILGEVSWEKHAHGVWFKKDNLIYVKPTTYMNESGQAIQECANFYKIAPEQIAIIHDDADVPLGTYRIKQGGRSAGHHGIDSIIQHLASNNFWRAKIGIRGDTLPGAERKKALNFVLQSITSNDKVVLYNVFDAVAKSLTNVMEKEMTPSAPVRIFDIGS